MKRRLLPLIIATLALSVAGACRTPESAPPPAQGTGATSTPPPLLLPDLSSTADSVQRQIRARHDALTATLARAGASAAERAAAYGDLGRVLMAARFNAEAALCYAHAQTLEPAEIRWTYLRGHAELRNSDRAAAIAAFERALTITPTDLTTLIWLAETQLDDGRVDQAQVTFQRALTVDPRSAAALFGAGRAALSRQAYADAARSMEQALAVEPAASAIHYPLSVAYRALGDPAKADAHLRQRGSAYPELMDSRLGQDNDVLESAVSIEGRGMDALKRGDFAVAESAFRQGLALSPNDASLRYWLGATLFASGKAAESEREFLAVVQQSPNFANAHFSLGAIADAGGRRAEAIARYRAAVRADPSLPAARLRLAADLSASGQFEEAVTEYRAAVGLDPNVIDAWSGGAKALIALGRRRDADEWLARATRIHPNRPELTALQPR